MEDLFYHIRPNSSNFEARVLGFRVGLKPPTPDTVHYNNDETHLCKHENDSTSDFEDNRYDRKEGIKILHTPGSSPKSDEKALSSTNGGLGGKNNSQSSSVDKEDQSNEDGDQSSNRGEASHNFGKDRSLLLGAPQSFSFKFSTVYEALESRSITISDDLSHGAKVEERQFFALRISTESLPPEPVFSSNLALQDYQAQLMLIEQQNKRRFMMARQQQDMWKDTTALSSFEATVGFSTQTAQIEEGSSLGKRKRTVSDDASSPELNHNILSLDRAGLLNYITRLENRAKDLDPLESDALQTRSYCTLHRILEFKQGSDGNAVQRVLSVPFFDPPEWVGSSEKGTLKCRAPVENLDLYLERNKHLSFIVYKTYVAPDPQSRRRASLQLVGTPKCKVDESIRPITEDLITGIRTLLESKDEYSELWQLFKGTNELNAPYLFVYHQRADWDKLCGETTQSSQEELMIFWNYVTQNHGEEYAAADRLIARGRITSRYIQYLFKPGDILVEWDGDFHLGWVAKSWAKYQETSSTMRGKALGINTVGSRVPLYGTPEASKRMTDGKLWIHTWRFGGWHWEFDGNFQRRDKVLSLCIPEETSSKSESANTSKARYQDTSAEDSVSIRDLRVYPIQYAPADIVQKLRKRGKTFWKCRVRSLVSYEDHPTDAQENTVDERYMIDLQAYRSLHKNNQYDSFPKGSGLFDELGPEAMKRDEPPDENFGLLLPATIKGFNMRRKKWYDLIADRAGDVNWNKEAFQKIVMNRKAKDLIQALVSNQLAAETNTFGTDLIEGKGNGLILLMHGSPGTGKTLTAESVAEIAERPLYRVTCADIGTKAEDAEKYLESVLHLGKLWKCVVLLDEADVFLEQRSLEDLERNALVSVFLRVLEYYEGILILTSNRVGTFDEAFKSRIQLALHYPVLGPYERLQIWQNFFEKLDSQHDTAVDVDDLRDHLVELKEEEMNGRQIRNAITTARQYARWKGETLTYAKLKDVIEVAGRFDKYLDKLHRGLTQDQLAEDEGLRLR